jgi:hypothetical protein
MLLEWRLYVTQASAAKYSVTINCNIPTALQIFTVLEGQEPSVFFYVVNVDHNLNHIHHRIRKKPRNHRDLSQSILVKCTGDPHYAYSNGFQKIY